LVSHLGVGLVALVTQQRRVAADAARVQVHLVVALLLVLDEDRQLLEIQVPLAPVVLPGDGSQVDDLQVLSQGELDLVDVRELMAVGVHADVVGVALQHPGGGVPALRRHPR
jgi:hypothetical protein